jgi:hypothetical protein
MGTGRGGGYLSCLMGCVVISACSALTEASSGGEGRRCCRCAPSANAFEVVRGQRGDDLTELVHGGCAVNARRREELVAGQTPGAFAVQPIVETLPGSSLLGDSVTRITLISLATSSGRARGQRRQDRPIDDPPTVGTGVVGDSSSEDRYPDPIAADPFPGSTGARTEHGVDVDLATAVVRHADTDWKRVGTMSGVNEHP